MLADRQHDLSLGRAEVTPKKPTDIAFHDFVDVEKAHAVISVLPATQRSIGMSWRVRRWPMFANDQIGDCTLAGLAHGKQLWAAYAKGQFNVDETQVIAAYSAVTGYNPQTGMGDNGALLGDVCGFARSKGIQGKPDILAYADVDPADDNSCEVAHYLFAGLYCGIAMPNSAADQFRNGQVWEPGHGGDDQAGSWGGHCMWRADATLNKQVTFVTWGALHVATDAWWDAYVDEAKALVPVDYEVHMPDYLKKYGIVDFSKLNGMLQQVTKH